MWTVLKFCERLILLLKCMSRKQHEETHTLMVGFFQVKAKWGLDVVEWLS